MVLDLELGITRMSHRSKRHARQRGASDLELAISL
jgi:hypothetical protein